MYRAGNGQGKGLYKLRVWDTLMSLRDSLATLTSNKRKALSGEQR